MQTNRREGKGSHAPRDICRPVECGYNIRSSNLSTPVRSLAVAAAGTQDYMRILVLTGTWDLYLRQRHAASYGQDPLYLGD